MTPFKDPIIYIHPDILSGKIKVEFHSLLGMTTEEIEAWTDKFIEDLKQDPEYTKLVTTLPNPPHNSEKDKDDN